MIHLKKKSKKADKLILAPPTSDTYRNDVNYIKEVLRDMSNNEVTDLAGSNQMITDQRSRTLMDKAASFRDLPASRRPTYEAIPNDPGEANSNSLSSSLLKSIGYDPIDYPGIDEGNDIIIILTL